MTTRSNGAETAVFDESPREESQEPARVGDDDVGGPRQPATDLDVRAIQLHDDHPLGRVLGQFAIDPADAAAQHQDPPRRRVRERRHVRQLLLGCGLALVDEHVVEEQGALRAGARRGDPRVRRVARFDQRPGATTGSSPDRGEARTTRPSPCSREQQSPPAVRLACGLSHASGLSQRLWPVGGAGRRAGSPVRRQRSPRPP